MVGLKPPEVPPTTAVKLLGAGTAACFADLLTFPLDTAKVRLQIQGENQAARSAQYRGVLGTILTMVRNEGPRSLYNGLVAGLQRQMSFASIRIGLYDSVKQLYTPKGSDHSSITTLALTVTQRGATGGSCPEEGACFRAKLQASLRVGPSQGRALLTDTDNLSVFKHPEAKRGIYLRILPNITRNAIVNCAEMVTYDVIKEKVLDYHLLTDNLPCHFVSAFGAGFCATVVASPVDVVKTRYMNSPPGQYQNPLDCMLKTVTQEGPTAFYKGFTPSFLRLGSWNVVMFVSYEQLKRALMKVQMLRESPF
uniref:Mitochondrial uncoupling protein 3 n=1 Tax=Sus scrofa TaxID=9823 RepID=A0A8D0P7U6_PIG